MLDTARRAEFDDKLRVALEHAREADIKRRWSEEQARQAEEQLRQVGVWKDRGASVGRELSCDCV